MTKPDNTFLETKFLNSNYFHFVLPAVYFVVMLFISITNRPIGDYGVESDFFSSYAPQAKAILNGGLIIDPFKGPLYQIFLAVAAFILGKDYFLAGKILNVISASIALFFISRIISSVLSRDSAVMAVLIIAVNYTFLTYTYTPGTDMLFLSFYVSALYFILRNADLKNKDLLIAGILSSLAYLTRYTAISLIVFVILVFAFRFYKEFKKERSDKKSYPYKPVLYYLIPVIILSSAWGIVSYEKTGSFFYNLNYRNTAYTVYKPDDVSKDEWNFKNQDSFNSMSDVILKDPGAFIKRIFIQNLPLYFKKDITRLIPKYLGIFVALGLVLFFFKFRSMRLTQIYFFLASILFYFQILLIFYTERFSIPLLPFYSFLIVWFFSDNYFERFNFKISGIRIFAILLFILITFNFYNSIKAVRQEINVGPAEILAIKEWIEKNNHGDLKGKLIMARKPHIGYYLDMNYKITPFAENFDDYIRNVKEENADYIYISEKEADYITDEKLKQTLMNYDNPPEELEVVTNTTDPVAILYRVKK